MAIDKPNPKNSSMATRTINSGYNTNFTEDMSPRKSINLPVNFEDIEANFKDIGVSFFRGRRIVGGRSVWSRLGSCFGTGLIFVGSCWWVVDKSWVVGNCFNINCCFMGNCLGINCY